jgi:hypothetical protein
MGKLNMTPEELIALRERQAKADAQTSGAVSSQTTPCGECGMPNAGEYHPYAACLMFKACKDSKIVRENLDAVLREGEALAYAKRNLRI